jgi:hypothetical protein
MASRDLLPVAIIPGVAAPLPLPGSIVPGAGSDTHLDEFSKKAGPDVAYTKAGVQTEVYAVFNIDPKTHELRISVVDSAGRLLRMIPPESVGEMLAAMANYGRI